MLKTQKPEIEFVIAVTQPVMLDRHKERIKELTQQTLDWDYLIEFTLEQKLTPLFYHQIKAHFSEIIPLTVIEKLRQIVMNITGRNMIMTVELTKLLKIFKEAEIPVISFKGPILAQLVYGDISFRIFADLDLLIKESDLVKVHNLLTKKCDYNSYDFTDYQINKLSKLQYEFPYSHNSKNIPVDLHWHIYWQGLSFSPTPEIIWEKLEQVKLNNQEIDTLSLEILVVFLCIHSAKHGWTELSLICELAYLLSKNPQLNWQKIESYFGKFGTKRMILISLNLTQIFYNISLPETIEKEIEANSIVNKLSKKIQAEILFPKHKILNIFYIYLLHCQSMESWKDLLLLLCYRLINPKITDLQLIALPRILFLLYYPIRIFRLIMKLFKWAYSVIGQGFFQS